ncbi:MAG: CocE/NonD family hydrolase [Proteobacteria bacterium]|nr:CocE/NonD family hydrolase [Pseudomonadota bacterium]
MPSRLYVLAFIAFALPVNAQAPYGDIHVEENLMIPMRDGVRLATDIYRPLVNGIPLADKLPVLLQRTPYDKTGTQIVESAKFFASHGYVVALQDDRGLYASEGVFTKYLGEGQDGFDTIEYLATLPYGDGQVGMWGTSYGAHSQANAAKLKPPHLKTIVLNMGGMSNGWDHKVRNHGAFEIQQLTWAFRQLAVETDDPVVREMLKVETINDWLTVMPLRKGQNPLSVAPNFEDYILEMLTHGDYDDYWKHIDLNWVEHYDRTADVPMLLLSGWYDSYAGGTIQNYLALSERLDSPVQLIMGPWTHSGNTRSYAGNVEFGSDGAIDDFHHEFHLRWFDRHLKGNASDTENANVRIFVMGSGDGHKDENDRLYHGGYWKEGADWPLPGTAMTPYYLHADGSLNTSRPAGNVMPSTYTFDPTDPVPTIGGSFSSTSPVFEPGAYDQRERDDVFAAKPPYLPLRSRADVLVFQTEPLDEDVEVVGPIVARLFVASTATDTDFTVKLIDVYPPSAEFPAGFEMNLTDGILRTRYRDRPDQQKLMEPGSVYEIEVTPFPNANRFKKGHRIRVDISSSNFPRFDVNPNTGEPLGKHRRTIKADNTIYHDASHPSHVVLPIIPAN